MDQPLTSPKPTVLISPMDWGLGHATRCIPIINALLRRNCNLLIGCEGKIKNLLQSEFPQLVFVDLKGYRINYSKNSWSLPFQIGKQIPKIISTIQYENERLKEIVRDYDVKGVISDNRYGFYHKNIPSVFITHQLRIKTQLPNFIENYLQTINYKYIKKFSVCWIPDYGTGQNLAGQLSHPHKMPFLPFLYIGPLSRYKKEEKSQETHLLVLLSGPEPQRTIFENLLIQQLKEYKGSVVLVRGLPEEKAELSLSPNISVYNHLPAAALRDKLVHASIVISRCGYSTVMDLAAMVKKSILIPTPGQTEQEYLATRLMKNNFALCIEQKKFMLMNALELSKQFHYRIDQYPSDNSLDGAIDEFVSSLI